MFTYKSDLELVHGVDDHIWERDVGEGVHEVEAGARAGAEAAQDAALGAVELADGLLLAVAVKHQAGPGLVTEKIRAFL